MDVARLNEVLGAVERARLSRRAWADVERLLERLIVALREENQAAAERLTIEVARAVTRQTKTGKSIPTAIRRRIAEARTLQAAPLVVEAWPAGTPGFFRSLMASGLQYARLPSKSARVGRAPEPTLRAPAWRSWRAPPARDDEKRLPPRPGTRPPVRPTPAPPLQASLARDEERRLPPEPSLEWLRRVDVAFRATMPGVVVVGTTATIHVTISRTLLNPAVEGEVADEDRAAVAPDVPLLVQVIPRVGFEAYGRDTQAVDVPGNKPARLEFQVRAVHASPGEIWVAVSQDRLPAALLKLRPELATEAATRKRVMAETDARLGGAAAGPLNRFDINERPQTDGVVYEYQLDLPEVGVFDRFQSDLISGDRDAFVRGLYEQLDAWTKRPGDREDLLENLRSFGGDLLDQLFPARLRELLWEHRDRLTDVMVVSTEPFIPWELLHLKTPEGHLPDEVRFLAQTGLVRWVWGTTPPARLRVRRDRVRYVIPTLSQLDATKVERAMLETELGATPIEPRVKAVRDALRQPNGFDLLHYAGHGEADARDFATARLLLDPPEDDGVKPDPLLVSIVRNHGRFGSKDHRPLVVLNACQAARTTRGLTSLGGFAEAFLEKWAGAFVGALWAVGDEPAVTFVDALYTQLRAGETFSDATAAARETARAEGDPTWLAYVVYAQPRATVEWIN